MQLRDGTEADVPSICALLKAEDLPTSDLSISAPQFLVACDASERIVAVGGLQWFGNTALLRSVVVAPSARGAGLGQRVVTALESAAREGRARELVLLTLTAKTFFEQQGYRIIDRRSVPEDVQASEEFRSLCPASAICMVKKLTAP
jgi:N-acetylglutamate synthase-like GNAT family acetyltransferase